MHAQLTYQVRYNIQSHWWYLPEKERKIAFLSRGGGGAMMGEKSLVWHTDWNLEAIEIGTMAMNVLKASLP